MPNPNSFNSHSGLSDSQADEQVVNPAEEQSADHESGEDSTGVYEHRGKQAIVATHLREVEADAESDPNRGHSLTEKQESPDALEADLPAHAEILQTAQKAKKKRGFRQFIAKQKSVAAGFLAALTLLGTLAGSSKSAHSNSGRNEQTPNSPNQGIHEFYDSTDKVPINPYVIPLELDEKETPPTTLKEDQAEFAADEALHRAEDEAARNQAQWQADASVVAAREHGEQLSKITNEEAATVFKAGAFTLRDNGTAEVPKNPNVTPLPLDEKETPPTKLQEDRTDLRQSKALVHPNVTPLELKTPPTTLEENQAGFNALEE